MVIPKLLNWKRAAFYFTYQGAVSRNPYSQVSSVPTLAERDGDFSLAKTNTPVTIYDPTDRRAVPRQRDPADALESRRARPAEIHSSADLARAPLKITASSPPCRATTTMSASV